MVKAIYTGTDFVEAAEEGGVVGVVLESTSFYAEQGGQIYDTGAMRGEGGGQFEVVAVQVYGGFVVHVGRVTGGRLRVGEKVVGMVEYERRARVAPNHTCTHLLNFALKEVVGQGVGQKGSLVDDAKLRFDFSHGEGGGFILLYSRFWGEKNPLFWAWLDHLRTSPM